MRGCGDEPIVTIRTTLWIVNLCTHSSSEQYTTRNSERMRQAISTSQKNDPQYEDFFSLVRDVSACELPGVDISQHVN
jgi:hypothetical protein